MSAVFLDLDGTLMNSAPGILATLRSTLTQVGRGDLAATDLSWMIGPPFIDSFTKAGLADPHVAIDTYREIYHAGGMFEAQVYDGVFAMLEELYTAGHRLYLATAKPWEAAVRITAHFGLSTYMAQEFGPELDGTRNWKGDLLSYAMEKTGERAEDSVMVGDRHHDFAAAASVGMKCVAVRWGYGTQEEWKMADRIVDHPSQLAGAIAMLGL